MNDMVEEPLTPEDLALLADLGRVVAAVDPVPAGLAERTLFALSLVRLEAEVLELQLFADAGIRSEASEAVEARTVTFASAQITVMITVTPDAPGWVRVDGWVAPAGRYLVSVGRPEGGSALETDDDGGFVLERVGTGPASLVLRRADGTGPTVSTPVTEW